MSKRGYAAACGHPSASPEHWAECLGRTDHRRTKMANSRVLTFDRIEDVTDAQRVAKAVNGRCPRCEGRVYEDTDNDIACLSCGWRDVGGSHDDERPKPRRLRGAVG